MTEYWNNDQQKLYILKLVEHPDFYIGDLNLASYPVSWVDWAKMSFKTPKSLELDIKGHKLFGKYFKPYKIELFIDDMPLRGMSARGRLFINRYFVTPFFASGSMFYVHDSGQCEALLELIMFNGKLDKWINMKIDQETTLARSIKESIGKV